MRLPHFQKKKPFVINTKIIIETNNEKYSLQKSSLPIDNIRSITRQDKKFGKYIAHIKIVRNIKTFAFGRLRKTFYSPDTLENLIKSSSIDKSENNEYYNMW